MDKITVDIEKLGKIYKAAKKIGMKEVSFEYLIGSCFPKAYQNIKEELRRQYTMGYAEGQKDKKRPD